MHWSWIVVIVPGLISGSLFAGQSEVFDEPFEFTVEGDRFGDTFRYRSADTTSQVDADGEWQTEHTEGEWLDTTSNVIDYTVASGEVRDVVVKVRHYAASPYFGEGTTRYWYNDLATQGAVGAGLAYPGDEFVIRYVSPPLPLLANPWEVLAGRTLQEGADLTQELAADWEPFSDTLWMASSWYSVAGETPTIDVIGGAEWNGQRALGVRLTGEGNDAYGVPNLWIAMEWIMWYVPGVPSPVYWQVSESAGEGSIDQINRAESIEWVSERNIELIGFKAGTTLVPWGQGDPHFRMDPIWSVPPLSDSLNGHVPDGNNQRALFDLDAAYVHAINDPTLLEFADWRTAHPEWYLAGFHYDAQTQGGPSWLLKFQESNLRSFEAFSLVVFQPTPGVLVARDWILTEDGRQTGEWNTQNDGPAPQRSLTIAQIDMIARNVVDEDLWNAGPVAIDWGTHWGIPAGETPQPWTADIMQASKAHNVFPQTLGLTYGSEDGSRETFVFSLETGELVEITRDARPAESIAGRLIPSEPDAEFGRVSDTPSAFQDQGANVVAAAAGGLSLLTLLGIVASRLFALAGHARVRGPRVLEHPRRERLMNLLEDSPGMDVSELARTTDEHITTTSHHLHVLRREGFAKSERDGRHLRWFPVKYGAVGMKQASILQNERTQAMLGQLAQMPGANRQELATAQGVTAQAVTWHLKRLIESGLVQRRLNGKQYRYYLLGSKPAAA